MDLIKSILRPSNSPDTGFLTIFQISGESIRIAGLSKGETFDFPRAIIVARKLNV